VRLGCVAYQSSKILATFCRCCKWILREVSKMRRGSHRSCATDSSLVAGYRFVGRHCATEPSKRDVLSVFDLHVICAGSISQRKGKACLRTYRNAWQTRKHSVQDCHVHSQATSPDLSFPRKLPSSMIMSAEHCSPLLLMNVPDLSAYCGSISEGRASRMCTGNVRCHCH